jgi:SAM-dependent methyltransferase
LLAAAVAAGADAVGLDNAEGMVAAATARVPQATVLLADAQTADLAALAPGPPFDAVLSRFGVMFFDDPVGAFTNLRSSARPGARIVAAIWRGQEQNPVFSLGLGPLRRRLASSPATPGVPGPDALADPDRTRDLLGAAGWSEVALGPLDVVLDYGLDGSDGVEHRLAMALTVSTGRVAAARLRPTLGESGWADVLEEMRAEIRGALDDGVVRIPGACWLLTATA